MAWAGSPGQAECSVRRPPALRPTLSEGRRLPRVPHLRPGVRPRLRGEEQRGPRQDAERKGPPPQHVSCAVWRGREGVPVTCAHPGPAPRAKPTATSAQGSRSCRVETPTPSGRLCKRAPAADAVLRRQHSTPCCPCSAPSVSRESQGSRRPEQARLRRAHGAMIALKPREMAAQVAGTSNAL